MTDVDTSQRSASTRSSTAMTIVLFMKGTPLFPQCGFSSRAIAILDHLGRRYETVDVLADQDIRQGIKEYSDWPTIPQLYVKGEFVGGSDIMMEMFESGELKQLVGGLSRARDGANVKGAARGTRKPLRRPFDWFVEPSGRNQYCNRRAKCKKGRKTAKNYFPLVPRARPDRQKFRHLARAVARPAARFRARRVERPWRATIPLARVPSETTYCDLTQSWSAKGGGVGTYIRHKRRHILDHGPHRHLLIIPGDARRDAGRGRRPRDHRDDRLAARAGKPQLPPAAAQPRGARGAGARTGPT